MRRAVLLLLTLFPAAVMAAPPPVPSPARIDAEAKRLMQMAHARGMAVAVVDGGKVVHVAAYGERNAAGEPLQTDTVMYAASLTKMAFGHLIAQLAQDKVIDLDASIASALDRPLPDYAAEPKKYADYTVLAGDERWRRLTPRLLLNHASGFANFAFLEPDGKLKFHFDPGSRYGYSGEGLILLQFVLERGLGQDVGTLMQQRVFDRFGMPRTSMMWREDFATNLADGWTAEGTTEPHDERSRVRAAGSMDTTIADMGSFAAGYVSGQGLSAAMRHELVRPQLAITTASQFPTLQPELPVAQRRRNLAAGLGVVTFTGPQGAGFYKGGHDDAVGNTLVCVEQGQRCVVILGNDVRAEATFPALVRFVLGETGVPWEWEYGATKAFVR
ncbi:TPA: beta-lactamase family protein [Stenotrophomonas maltophilia]|uniref:serine hydrolase domain-containing protein n=1 Tax=Stenotrophomonas TaxID=40323 RepID=UPI0013DCF61C|nr:MULTISPECIES: serine hydrolase domain-containing protein [Stenotrophomonas]MBH1591845.1 beta-lactamase family protein [Stenotrophomonas maltophilia]MDH2021186.1 beta-lactamase family protein [Stenotrophomonas sp. GD03680]HEL3747879.1 beta-lactamase family protein [Stenotrophomonas maltophilia]HEL7728833.1 beta-lactamase family protein [Stenotrophomonas maltophilia]